MIIKPIKISLNEWGAIFTWLTVFIITLIAMNNAIWEVKIGIYPVMALFVLYLACFMLVVNESIGINHLKLRASIFTLQLFCAFTINLYTSFDFLPILTIIWASVLPYFVSYKNSFLITTVVVVLWYLLDWLFWQDSDVIYSGLLFYTFHLFSVSMTINAMSAEQAKEKAEKLNTELESTQLLLGEASRQNERTRIARDLHDLLGHHLTALLINLQVAEHTTQGNAKENIIKCHSLAKLLMSDVREAVESIRENRSLNFENMLDKMVNAVPNLKFKIDIQYNFELDDIEIAKQLLSCIQESITNCLKHANATQINIVILKNEDKITLEIEDDGLCDRILNVGHGLTGITERIRMLNGTVDFDTNTGSLKTQIFIPVNS